MRTLGARSTLVVALLFAATSDGCSPLVHDPLPPPCRAIEYRDGVVFFHPYGNDHAPIGSLEVRTPKLASFLWVIEIQGGSPVRAIEYGVVPTGYKQNVPASGAPPALLEGQTYEVYCDGGIGRFEIFPSDLVSSPNEVRHYVVNLKGT